MYNLLTLLSRFPYIPLISFRARLPGRPFQTRITVYLQYKKHCGFIKQYCFIYSFITTLIK